MAVQTGTPPSEQQLFHRLCFLTIESKPHVHHSINCWYNPNVGLMCTTQNQNLRGGWGKLVLVYFHVMTIIDLNVKPWFSWSYVHQVSYHRSAINPIKPHFPMVTILGHQLAVWSSFNPGIFGGTISLILMIQSKTQLVLRKCAFFVNSDLGQSYMDTLTLVSKGVLNIRWMGLFGFNPN